MRPFEGKNDVSAEEKSSAAITVISDELESPECPKPEFDSLNSLKADFEAFRLLCYLQEKKYDSLIDLVALGHFLVCVPPTKFIQAEDLSLAFLETYVLRITESSNYISFVTLNGKRGEIADNYLYTLEGFNQRRKIRIISSETNYDAEYRAISVLSIETLLEGGPEPRGVDKRFAIQPTLTSYSRFLTSFPAHKLPMTELEDTLKVIKKKTTSIIKTLASEEQYLHFFGWMKETIHVLTSKTQRNLLNINNDIREHCKLAPEFKENLFQIIQNFVLSRLSDMLMPVLVAYNFPRERELEAIKSSFQHAPSSAFDLQVSEASLIQSVKLLEEMSSKVCPIEKIACVQASINCVLNEYNQKGSSLSTDDLISVLTYLIIRTKSIDLYANICFIELCNETKGSEWSFVVTNLQAVTFYMTTQLKNAACIDWNSFSLTRPLLRSTLSPQPEIGCSHIYAWGEFPGSFSYTSPTLMECFEGMNVVSVVSGGMHIVVGTWDGKLYTFGSNIFGQLGLGHFKDKRNPRALSSTSWNGIFSAGSAHTVAASSDGRVYSWGWNKWGQLGFYHKENEDHPSLVELQGDTVKMIACGGGRTLCLTENNDIYFFGKPTSISHSSKLLQRSLIGIPQKYDKFCSVKITKIACGWNHALCVTENSEVFSWGSGSDGKLGHNDVIDHDQPKRIESLDELLVVDVVAGYYHSAAVTSSGDLYTWGWGQHGQLGHGDTENQLAPKLVSYLSDQNVSICFADCGGSHSIAVSKGGEIYTWGLGDNGQLGHGDTNQLLLPKCLLSLKGKPYLLSTGLKHSMIVTWENL